MTETLLSTLTTLGVGGPARKLVRATTEDELIEAVRTADEAGERLLVLGGGSNLVIGDGGFEGTVVQVATRGIEITSASACGGTFLRAEAGEPWDEVVRYAVEHELVGLETLSGIPGTAGATPVQNVGAYGTEISQYLSSCQVWDRQDRRRRRFAKADLDFAYRDSLLKREYLGDSPRYVVLSVEFQLLEGILSAPIRYAELARSLDTEVGQRAPSRTVRETVLRLRAGKGMVLDPQDRDTCSAGSFFTNPIIPVQDAERIPQDAPRYPVLDADGRTDESLLKLSAAWLIQHAGFEKGYGLEAGREVAGGRVSLSTKHTLALTNRGGATAADVRALALAVRDGVQEAFGVVLVPEPVRVDAGF